MTSSTGSYDFPIVLTVNGLVPQSPSSIQVQLLANVAAVQPGYTANLPGLLIEDISSTDVAAIVLCNQAQVETVNSLTPFGANQFTLTQLGQVYGVYQGQPTNTSVFVVFSGTVGYVIPNGFLVQDGTNVYAVQGGGVIQTGGSSAPINAISITAGSFGVPANTVTQLVTSAPSGISLSVNNPTSGTPGGTAETPYSFRIRVLQAGLAASVGTSRFIKTLVGQVPGAQAALMSVQPATGGLRVIVAGGDPYAIAYAIFSSVADPTTLQGSAVSSGRNITATLIDSPNTFNILWVNPPVQTVTITATWNTSLSTFTGGGAFPSLVQQPLANYINGLAVGAPINVLELNGIFQTAIASVLDPNLLTRLVFAVYINTVLTAPGTGTYAITGDPESYFLATASGITVTQG
jgi:Baseplate J-like protein